MSPRSALDRSGWSALRHVPLAAWAVALAFAAACASLHAQSPSAAPAGGETAVTRDVRFATLLRQVVIDVRGRELGRVVDAVVDLNNDRLTGLVLKDGDRREVPLDALVPRDRGLEASVRGTGRPEAGPTPPRPASASDLIGTRVKDAEGADLGRIEDLVISLDDLTLRYAVVQLPDAGEPRLVPLPLRAFTRADSGELRASVTRAQLGTAPAFTRDAWPRLSDPAYQARLRAWFANVPVRDATSVKSNQG